MASGLDKLRRHQTRSFCALMNILNTCASAADRTCCGGHHPILRIISKHQFNRPLCASDRKCALVLLKGSGHLHVSSHGLPTHPSCPGQQPVLSLLDARLGHFSDPVSRFPCLVILPFVCARSAPRRSRPSHPLSSVRAICLTLECGHLRLRWMA